MPFNHGLKAGDAIDNQQLTAIFKCGPQGGMRRSHKTNTLVIISDHTKTIYEDRWVNDTFHYTGMGMEGDQSLDFAQNKTLAQSPSNNVEVYLFEVFEKGQYTFLGQVRLFDKPYQEQQPDKNGHIRNVWIFPLKIIGENMPLPSSTVLKNQEQRQKEARRLSDDELESRIKYSREGIGIRQVSTTTYERNPYVAELAKRRANGICQLCLNPAPFIDNKGIPFLETHHIEWLSQGGEDSIENTVALCPNCHRKMHILNLNSDRNTLKTKTAKGI